MGQLEFHKRGTFAWKIAVLTVVTLAFVPVLLYQSVLGAKFYVGALVVIHVVAIATFLIGVQKQDIAPSRSGLIARLVGLAVALVLLGIAEKGLRTDFGQALFWWSLFGIWALHTGGLALLHIRGRSEQTCIFASPERRVVRESEHVEHRA